MILRKELIFHALWMTMAIILNYYEKQLLNVEFIKKKTCSHHLNESKAFVCYQCDKLKLKIMRIDNVNVCSLKCLKDYLNAQVK